MDTFVYTLLVLSCQLALSWHYQIVCLGHLEAGLVWRLVRRFRQTPLNANCSQAVFRRKTSPTGVFAHT